MHLGHAYMKAVVRFGSAGVAGQVDKNKKALALLSACLLALVPWMQISRAVSSTVDVSLAALAAVVAAGVAVHLVYLAFNSAAVQLLRIGGPPGKECESSWPLPILSHLHGEQKTTLTAHAHAPVRLPPVGRCIWGVQGKLQGRGNGPGADHGKWPSDLRGRVSAQLRGSGGL